MESADLRRWRPRHDPPEAGGAARSKPITDRHAHDSSPAAHGEFGSFWRPISSVVSSRGSERRVERCGHPFPTRTHLLRLSRQNLSPVQANTTASSQGLTIMVLQLWSNRTWSTWLLFWSRKWLSEASTHHFFPLRGLCEGCALPGAEEIFIDLGGGAPKTPIFTPKLTHIRIFTVFAP